MDVDHYAEDAMALVNADLSSPEALRRYVAGRPWLEEQLRPEDLPELVAGRAELAGVVDASAGGDEQDVVARLNRLLAVHPIRPRISGHDAQSWHLHVSGEGATTSEVLLAEALFGLTVLVTDRGALRLGRCAADGCGRAFLDLSPSHSKRFCSVRCATRTNVAAHRRRQLASSEGHPPGPADP